MGDHMRVSAKGRYGLAAMTHIASQYETGVPITIISIAEKLGISKIYLEQVFSLLKRANLVISIKGAQGGYQLAKAPVKINALEVLSAIELSLFEKTEAATSNHCPEIDKALQNSIFTLLDNSVQNLLSNITLVDLVIEMEKNKSEEALMYFI